MLVGELVIESLVDEGSRDEGSRHLIGCHLQLQLTVNSDM